jgi:hypothetical protein
MSQQKLLLMLTIVGTACAVIELYIMYQAYQRVNAVIGEAEQITSPFSNIAKLFN